MKPPIFIDEHGDITAFESVEHAELSLEAVDVRNQEYVAYDSDGKLLNVGVGPADSISISEISPVVDAEQGLKQALLNVFARHAPAHNELERRDLHEIVSMFVKLYGYER
jgi:hypothetical protein